MLKRITKFVLERGKTVQTPQQQFVENDDTTDPTSASERRPGELASQPVWAKLKWYTPDKRYGLVNVNDPNENPGRN